MFLVTTAPYPQKYSEITANFAPLKQNRLNERDSNF